jgi:hypothetical protein
MRRDILKTYSYFKIGNGFFVHYYIWSMLFSVIINLYSKQSWFVGDHFLLRDSGPYEIFISVIVVVTFVMVW